MVKRITLIIILAAVTMIGLFYIFSVITIAPSKTENANNSENIFYSAEEIAIHNSKTDCWTIISKEVYDITDYINNHPGGNEILKACGIDATSLFLRRETADGTEVGSGQPHSKTAENQLKKYQIGLLQ